RVDVIVCGVGGRGAIGGHMLNQITRALAFAAGLTAALLFSSVATAQDQCEYPQTPRDITQSDGAARGTFPLAPSPSEMNLCNVHFHVNAEHKGPDYMSPAATSDKRGGFVCNARDSLTAAERRPVEDVCGHGSDSVKAGDTIEVHWVFTSCPVSTVPG